MLTKVYKINGEDRPVKFNMMAIDLLSKRTGLSIDRLRAGSTDIGFFLEVAFAGLYGGKRVKYTDPDPGFAYEEVISYFDNPKKNEKGVLMKIFEQFSESIAIMFGEDEEEEKEAKAEAKEEPEKK